MGNNIQSKPTIVMYLDLSEREIEEFFRTGIGAQFHSLDYRVVIVSAPDQTERIADLASSFDSFEYRSVIIDGGTHDIGKTISASFQSFDYDLVVISAPDQTDRIGSLASTFHQFGYDMIVVSSPDQTINDLGDIVSTFQSFNYETV